MNTRQDEAKETFRRYEAVRAAKAAKFRSGKPADLTPAELDVILPPVPCARTRHRVGNLRPVEAS